MRHHRASVVTAPGVAQATYDAVAAKLVSVGSWLDLTATITTACAGAAASDPDSLAAGLTVTTATGTFDGATVDCNSFAWTTHASTNDGYSETLNYDLGTLASLITGYNPTTHGVDLECCLVEVGALNSAIPLAKVALAPAGSMAASTPIAGWAITSTTSVRSYTVISNTGLGFGLTAIDPASTVARTLTRRLPIYGNASTALLTTGLPQSAASLNYWSAASSNLTHSATDKLLLLLGQTSATSGAVTFKARFRARIFAHANVDLADLTLGCMA